MDKKKSYFILALSILAEQIGTAVTPIVGYLFYKQKITRTGVFGLVLIVISTVTLNLYG